MYKFDPMISRALSIFAAPVIILILLVLQSCSASDNTQKSDFTESPTGLKYKVLREGSGEPAKKGREVMIHETMSYANDSLLFDSRTLPGPVKVLVGGGQAIDGVDEGLVGMKVGELKKLIVPPELSRRSGPQTFPHPDSTLVYEIELIEILAPE